MFKRTIPVLFTAVAGFLMLLNSYLDIPLIHSLASEVRAWAPIMVSFAVITGTFNLIGVHGRTVSRKNDDRYFSGVFLLLLVITVTIGLSQGTTSSLYDFLYNKMLVPCSSTMAGMTAFFIASASYRAFRASNVDSGFLLVSAFLVMLGRVPIGEAISQHMPLVAQWLMDIPNLAGQRAFLVCSGIGFMSLCLRTIIGLHRAHLGAGE